MTILHIPPATSVGLKEVGAGPACWADGAGEKRERIGLSPKTERGLSFYLFLNFVFKFVFKLFCILELI
jgi:hypothetical protein